MDPNEPLPAFVVQLPPTFPIGTREVTPLLHATDLSEHLLVLAAFHRLEQRVKETPAQFSIHSQYTVSEPIKWIIFLHRALYRFERWVEKVVERTERVDGYIAKLSDDEIPPLDVLLMLHSLMLNPRTFAEDVDRICPSLGKIGGFPLKQLAARIHLQTFEMTVSPTQIVEWEELTQMPFDMPMTTSLNDIRPMECPQCLSANFSVPWIVMPTVENRPSGMFALGLGYLQNSFGVVCPTCQLIITKDKLCMVKFARDLFRCRYESYDAREIFFPFTTLDPVTGQVDRATAYTLRNVVCEALPNPQAQNDNWVATFCAKLGWDIENIHQYLEQNPAVRALAPPMWRRIGQIFAAYRHESRFSVDLVYAVQRQGVFTSAMVESLGWAPPPRRFARDDSQLSIAIARYHAFLDLHVENPYLVPTQDIDLVWHTHQLRDRYRAETLSIVGRFIDHSDKIEEGLLSQMFQVTASLWKKRFGVKYSLCECQAQASDLTASETPPIEMPQLSATHPSEHNSITILGNPNVANTRAERRRVEAARVSAIGAALGLDEIPGNHAAFLRTSKFTTSPDAGWGAMGLPGFAMAGEVDPNTMTLDAVDRRKGKSCVMAYEMDNP